MEQGLRVMNVTKRLRNGSTTSCLLAMFSVVSLHSLLSQRTVHGGGMSSDVEHKSRSSSLDHHTLRLPIFCDSFPSAV